MKLSINVIRFGDSIFNYICRVSITKDGRKRKLVIKDCKVTDAGAFACTTNADRTEAEILVQCEYALLRVSTTYFLTKGSIVRYLKFNLPRKYLLHNSLKT